MENIFTSYIVPIITFVFGCYKGVFLPNKFRKDDKKPLISISPLQENQNYFDITNHGGDLIDFKIELLWPDEGKDNARIMDRYFNADEDPSFGHFHRCNSLKKGETKKVINCPLYSDNGEVIVNVSGYNTDKREYSKKFVLINKKKI